MVFVTLKENPREALKELLHLFHLLLYPTEMLLLFWLKHVKAFCIFFCHFSFCDVCVCVCVRVRAHACTYVSGVGRRSVCLWGRGGVWRSLWHVRPCEECVAGGGGG